MFRLEQTRKNRNLNYLKKHEKDKFPKIMKNTKIEKPTIASMKHSLDNPIRTRLRLSEIERLIRKHRIIVPAPSRKGLIALCDEGVFETVGNKPTRLGWLVYEDSFWRWVREMDEEENT